MRAATRKGSIAAATALAAVTTAVLITRADSGGASRAATGTEQVSSTVAAPSHPSSDLPSPAPSPHLGKLPDGPTGPAHAAPPSTTGPTPTRLIIARIGVRTALQPLGLDAHGVLDSPAQWQVPGWYAGGVRPGDVGPAVIAGHVDSVAGPAVFSRLSTLRAGMAVSVVRSDGSTVRFVVATVRSYPKVRFPTAVVYSPTAVPVLRLVTCGGAFDAAARSYVDNIVVTAYLG